MSSPALTTQLTDRLQDVFEDLMSRFIINVPEQEIATTERICFQIEQAHWYYEDFLRELEPSLPGFTLKRFAAEMFQRCPLLRNFLVDSDVEEIYNRFVAYKMNVPVCGSIILNDRMDKILLVRGWSARSTWTFPKGKINQDEADIHCAIRETMEEIGFDISQLVKEEDYIELVLRGEQRNRLYIIPGISETTEFQTRTRKEIGDIKWHRIADLPRFQGKKQQQESDAKFYMIKRFMGEIGKWIAKYKKQNGKKSSRSRNKSVDSVNTAAAITLSSSPQSFVDHSETLKAILGITPSKSSLVAKLEDDLPASHSSYSVSRQSTVNTLDSTAARQLPEWSKPHPVLDAQASLLSILNGEPQPPPSAPSSVPISRPSTNQSSLFGYHEPVGQSYYGSTPPSSLGPQMSSHNMELLSILKGSTLQSHATTASSAAIALSPIGHRGISNFAMAPSATLSSAHVPIMKTGFKPLTPSSIIQSQSNDVYHQTMLLSQNLNNGTPPMNYAGHQATTPSSAKPVIMGLLTPSHVSVLNYSKSEPLMPATDTQHAVDLAAKQKRKAKKQQSSSVVETRRPPKSDKPPAKPIQEQQQQQQRKQNERPATASDNQEGNFKKKTILKKSQSTPATTDINRVTPTSSSDGTSTGVTPAKKKISILKRQESAAPSLTSPPLTNGRSETKKDIVMADSPSMQNNSEADEKNGSRRSSMAEFKFNISDIMKMFSGSK